MGVKLPRAEEPPVGWRPQPDQLPHARTFRQIILAPKITRSRSGPNVHSKNARLLRPYVAR